MKVTVKEPKLAYKGNLLWLPKSSVNLNQVVKDLTFEVVRGYGNPPIIHELFQHCKHHIRVPREYPIPPGVEVVDITPKSYAYTGIEDMMDPRDDQQEDAWDALECTQNGVLHLACGIGKTALSIKWAVMNDGPILVVVYDTGTFPQWESSFRRFTDYRGRIGVIQGNRLEWKHPVVFASISTLANRHNLPVEARHWFKSIIFDECHHVAAATLKTTLPMFWGHRLGLSATPKREDSLEPIIYYHMGNIFHSDERQPLTPKVTFLVTGTQVNPNSPHIRSRTKVITGPDDTGYWAMGDVNLSKLHKHLGELDTRNNLILAEVEKARQKDRKVLVLSHNVAHVEALSRARPQDSIAVHGEVRGADRAKALRDYPVVFATIGVAAEALDAPALDTVFFTTPFQADRLLTQGMGRALRAHPGKKPPVIVILFDSEVSLAASLCRKLMTHLKTKGFEYNVVVPKELGQ